MVPRLDLFATENARVRWLGCAETLVQALELVSKRGPGSYFVFSQETGRRNFYEVTSNGGVVHVVLPDDPKGIEP